MFQAQLNWAIQLWHCVTLALIQSVLPPCLITPFHYGKMHVLYQSDVCYSNYLCFAFFNIIFEYPLFRNWESGILLCSHPLLEEDVTALVFNPMNWCQIGAVNLRSLTIWNVERCDNYHLMKPWQSVSPADVTVIYTWISYANIRTNAQTVFILPIILSLCFLGSAVDLPATDGSVIECEANLSYMLSRKLTHLGPQMPISAIAGLSGDRADDFVVWVVSPVECFLIYQQFS